MIIFRRVNNSYSCTVLQHFSKYVIRLNFCLFYHPLILIYYLNYVKLLPNFEKTVLVCLENDFLFCFLNVSYLFSVFINGCFRIDIMIKVKIFQICLFLVHENCFEQTAHAMVLLLNFGFGKFYQTHLPS